MSIEQWSETGEPFLALPNGYRLTPLREDDAPAYLTLKNTPEILEWNFFNPKPSTLEEVKKSIASSITKTETAIESLRSGQRDNQTPFNVIRDSEGNVVGSCSIFDPFEPSPLIGAEDRLLYKHQNIGWSLLPDVWGRGLATAAARALIEYAKDHLEDDTIGGGCDARNVRSIGLFARLNFERVHIHREVLPSGEDFTGHWYTLRLR